MTLYTELEPTLSVYDPIRDEPVFIELVNELEN